MKNAIRLDRWGHPVASKPKGQRFWYWPTPEPPRGCYFAGRAPHVHEWGGPIVTDCGK